MIDEVTELSKKIYNDVDVDWPDWALEALLADLDRLAQGALRAASVEAAVLLVMEMCPGRELSLCVTGDREIEILCC